MQPKIAGSDAIAANIPETICWNGFMLAFDFSVMRLVEETG
jgi:hypothetical protein